MGAMTRDGDGRKAPPLAVFAAGDIVLTPLNQRAKLTQKRAVDGYWDAVYLDDEGNPLDTSQAPTILQPKHMRHE